MKNKKGAEAVMTTIVIVAAALLVLMSVSVYFFKSFGTSAGGLGSLMGRAAEETGEEEAQTGIHAAIIGGECKGEVGLHQCYNYYQEGLKNNWPHLANCKVEKCTDIGCYPADSWGTFYDYLVDEERRWTGIGNCMYPDHYPYTEDRYGYVLSPGARAHTATCATLTKQGKEICECAGCYWESY